MHEDSVGFPGGSRRLVELFPVAPRTHRPAAGPRYEVHYEEGGLALVPESGGQKGSWRRFVTFAGIGTASGMMGGPGAEHAATQVRARRGADPDASDVGTVRIGSVSNATAHRYWWGSGVVVEPAQPASRPVGMRLVGWSGRRQHEEFAEEILRGTGPRPS